MGEPDLKGRIRGDIAGVLGSSYGIREVKPEHRLREDYGLDSLDLIELVVAVEDMGNIKFDMVYDAGRDRLEIETVGELENYFWARASKRESLETVRSADFAFT